MGWGKKIKKAVKKTVKKITKPVEKAVKQVGKAGEDIVKGAAGIVGGAAGIVGGALGQGGKPDVQVIEQAAPVAAPPPAQIIEAPTKGDVETEDEAQTESGKKKARAGGKKSLSVARSSGGGLNI